MKPKGVKIVTEEAEKDVTFLVDVDPLFISLVAHGANQQPFRVIKEESEKGGMGSGHPRHDGREGEKGGSNPYDGSKDWMRHGGSVGMKDRIINIGEVPMKFAILPEVIKGGPGSGHFGHEGRPREVGGSVGEGGEGKAPESRGGITPLKEFKNEEVFSSYVVKASWGKNAGNEKWVNANRQVGALEARIGHMRVKAGATKDEKRQRVLLTIASEYKKELTSVISERDRTASKEDIRSLDEVFKAEGKITSDEVSELERESIKDIDEEVIKRVAAKLKISEEEVKKILGEKSEKGGEGMGMIIQSILLPKGVSMDVLMSQKGLEFLADADQEQKKEFDRYTKFDQLPVEKFDKDSLNLVKIHDNGVWVVGGKLIDEKDAENAMTVGIVKKQMEMQPNVMNTPIASIENAPIEVTFGQVFNQELSALVETIQGILSQSGREGATRKSDVLNALDAFGAFLSMSLDSLGEKAVKLDIKPMESKEKTEGGEEDMFKTKEEFVAAVTDVFKGLIAKQPEETEEQKKKRLEEEEKKRLESKQPETEEEKKKRLEEEEKKRLEEEGKKTDIRKIAASIEAIEKQVKELAEKTEKIGASLMSDPTVTIVDDPAKKKVDEKPSVFKGMFSKRISQQAQS